jgi:hypothetical protein
MSYAFYFLLCSIVLRYFAVRYKALEEYAGFIISVLCMGFLTERGIYMSQNEYRFSTM